MVAREILKFTLNGCSQFLFVVQTITVAISLFFQVQHFSHVLSFSGGGGKFVSFIMKSKVQEQLEVKFTFFSCGQKRITKSSSPCVINVYPI